MPKKNILWVDNDPGNLESLIRSLNARGYVTTICTTVSEAEQAVNATEFDLLILDVMIPVTEGELGDYSYADTEDTLGTGLVFYKRMRELLAARGTPILVMTVRIDKAIAEAFAATGLPAGAFATRYELRNTKTFLARVEQLLGDTRNE